MSFIFWFAVFLILFLSNRNRYFNVLVTAALLLGTVLFLLNKTFFNFTGNETIDYILFATFTFGFVPFILLLLASLTFFNSKILLEKEGRRPRNLFFSLIGLASLAVLFLYLYFYFFKSHSAEAEIIILYIIGLFVYGMLMFSATSLYAFIYQIIPIFYRPAYIIVLGSGLIGDRVPPLLASRIRKGVQQYKRYGKEPILIMSGGQGSDELISEGEAMRRYAIEQCGLSEQDVLAETQSTTTHENLLLSKQLLGDRSKEQGIIVTNNFHALRAGFYAKKTNLKAIGVGSKTALYYLPNAFMREFIAILQMYKWFHIVVFLLYSLMMYLLLYAYL